MRKLSTGRLDVPPVEPVKPPLETPRGVLEIAGAFSRLGCVSFGGPVAHLGYLHAEFVEKRKWLDDAHYSDLVALCQFLPGPASSQVVFALGMHRAGLVGAAVASACFTLPSALLMIAFAYGLARVGDLARAGWLHGLKLAAVAVVAQAVWIMGKKLCTDRTRTVLCLASAAVLVAVPGTLTQMGVIAFGGLVGMWRDRTAARAAALAATHASPAAFALRTGQSRGTIAATAALAVFVALLAVLPVLASTTGIMRIAVFDSFYRSGSLVFGGGHVVLPLLRAEVVPRGWLSDDQFLAGYAAAQALPGPMFAFAAYLGTAMDFGSHLGSTVGRALGSALVRPQWLNGVWCLLAIFLPAWLLIGGVLPFWHRLRAKRWAQAALAGANASVVGILLAALYSPLITESVRGSDDVAAALIAFSLLQYAKAPPWLVVILMAAAGQWALAV